MKKMKDAELGQILLVILLVMTVGLTIVLAVVSRSITDIRISQQEEDSARALSVAEAGIERALVGGPSIDTIGGITYRVSSEVLGDSKNFDFGGGKFAAGDTQTVWLLPHVANGEELDESGVGFPYNEKITVCWGDNPEDKSALEVILIYKGGVDADDFKIGRRVFDADYGRAAENKFDQADDIDGDNCGSKLAFGENIDFTDFTHNFEGTKLYVLRLKLLYNNQPQPLAVSSESEKFPSQGNCYISTAGGEESGITRRVRQCQFYKSPPEIFDYVLFSEEDLTK